MLEYKLDWIKIVDFSLETKFWACLLFFTHPLISNSEIHFILFSFWILYLSYYNNVLLLFFSNHFYQIQSFHDKCLKLNLLKLYLFVFNFSTFFTKPFLEYSLFWSRSFFQMILHLLCYDNTLHFPFLQSFYETQVFMLNGLKLSLLVFEFLRF